MRVAVVHYHLRPGGVTRVIERAAAAVRPHGIETALISGDPGGPARNAHATLPWLDYARGPGSHGEAMTELLATAERLLGGPPDVWHIHNHSLGKNAVLPALVCELAQRQTPMLLQIHDFAEDGRPVNYRRLREWIGPAGLSRLYPAAPRIRYALLNRRDREIMTRAGLPEQYGAWLPNPVEAPANPPRPKEGSAPPLFLYPARGIRRKNLGELLLWGACLRGEARFALTLAPENPEALPVYRQWETLAESLDLPVALGVGADPGRSFGDWLAAAHAVVTTSVAEGFGLAFLEPWTTGLPLCGRNLPDITADFADADIRLDGLYDRLDVPGEWINLTELRRRIEQGLMRSRNAYGLDCTPADIEQAWNTAAGAAGIDFGRLDETLQADVIRRIAGSDVLRGGWRPPGHLAETVAPQYRDRHIQANAARISEHFGPEPYGRRLAELYHALASAPPGDVQSLSPDQVLQAFADPGRFCLLRT